MKKVILDGAMMGEKTAAHEHIAVAMDFPGWYGKNLDALWDMLSACGDTEVELMNAPALLNALGDYACRLLGCFYEAAEENERLKFRVT